MNVECMDQETFPKAFRVRIDSRQEMDLFFGFLSLDAFAAEAIKNLDGPLNLDDYQLTDCFGQLLKAMTSDSFYETLKLAGWRI